MAVDFEDTSEVRGVAVGGSSPPPDDPDKGSSDFDFDCSLDLKMKVDDSSKERMGKAVLKNDALFKKICSNVDELSKKFDCMNFG